MNKKDHIKESINVYLESGYTYTESKKTSY